MIAIEKFSFAPVSFFVAVHKNVPLPQPCQNYIVLGIGGYRPADYPFALTDEGGDSIAEKNKYYSELTGWYWLWKNLSNIKVVGLCHYRRYFILNGGTRFIFFRPRKKYFDPTPQNFKRITSPENSIFVEKTLAKYEVIVPRRAPLGMSISQYYKVCHVQEDWELFIRGIRELYPEYSSELEWFDKTNYMHVYNMMIAPKEFFDRYMSTLFALLFWMEKQRPFRNDPYQCRVPAFLAERFFSFYLHVTGTRYAEVSVAISEPGVF